jgi:hypothetical protein
VRGLRLAGHEAQLTQVIAAVGATDPRFAGEFVRLALAVAGSNAAFAPAVRALGRVPDELRCVAEHTVYDRKDRSLGRVDLRFDGDDFTLLVENKLHSDFGLQQLHRYEDARRLLPAGRSGLLAITRNVPSHNEMAVRGRGWLGAIRWAHLADGMRGLRIADGSIAAQWPLFIDVLDAQGDLGVTSVNAELVRAWAHYLDGREVLVDLLGAVRERAHDIVAEELVRRYPGYGPASKLCAPLMRGKRGVVAIKHEQQAVSTGFTVPAREKAEAAILVHFWMEAGEAYFGVRIDPWDGYERARRNEPQLRAAALKLGKAGFRNDQGSWWSQYTSADYLDCDDVPMRLLELVRKDMRAVARSDILLADVKRFRRRPVVKA